MTHRQSPHDDARTYQLRDLAWQVALAASEGPAIQYEEDAAGREARAAVLDERALARDIYTAARAEQSAAREELATNREELAAARRDLEAVRARLAQALRGTDHARHRSASARLRLQQLLGRAPAATISGQYQFDDGVNDFPLFDDSSDEEARSDPSQYDDVSEPRPVWSRPR